MDLIRAVQAVGPILFRALKNGQLFNPQCRLTEPDPDILCEYDVHVPTSEGLALTVNIYRSKSAAQREEKVPVVMCAHPYDNHLTPARNQTPFGGPPQQYRIIPQSAPPTFSKLTSWESPDPNFWVAAGYAVVNMNLPGYANSGGPPTVFSEHQAKCYYEAIEWIAKQSWCDGNVGLNGVSFLAISQFHVAACQLYGGPPPSLRCISPWEGLTDPYRDIFCRGGLTETGFPAFWWITEVKPAINGTEQDFVHSEGSIPTEFLDHHPFNDEFWQAKAAKLEQISVPMLVCASFSDHGLHTEGSFLAFTKAQSPHKWVYTHRSGKWDVYYSPEVQEMTRAFMDCFLKGDTANGFLDTPRVRLEVRSGQDQIHAIRFEDEWPLARTRYTRLHLSEGPPGLVLERPEVSATRVYSATGGRTSLAFTFKEDTELTGYMKLRLWVEARSGKVGDPVPDDMALLVAINKLDKAGIGVNFYGSVGNELDMVSRGCLRVSRRELDLVESTEWRPVLTGLTEQRLKAGEVVPVDIALYPSSTFFAAGETLQLIISSAEIIPSPPYKKDISCNHGTHVLHFGGQYDAYLLIPEIPILIKEN